MEEYKDIMKEMYAQICDFVVNNPDIECELVDLEREFLCLSFSECNPRKLFFDWFIFDHILNKYRVRLFDFYLRRKKKSIPKILYDVYLKIGGDRFSFFKIKAVKIGKQFLCQDILTGKEYQVFESSLTKSIGKGDYIIGRLLPFAEAFILASQCLCYKSQDYDMFSLVMKNAVPAAENRIDPYDVYKTLYPQNIPEKLLVEEKFTLLCKEGGLSDDDIEDILLSTRIAVKDKNTPPQQVIPGVIEKMKEQEWFSMEEFYQAFVNVWNSFAEQIHPGVRKGPIEISLINVCMDVLGEKFLLPPNMSEKGKNREQNSVFVGRRPTMNYVMATMMILNTGEDCTVKARGRAISHAVDVCEILRNRFLKGTEYKDIRLSTEQLEGENGQSNNVSSIEIVLAPPK